MPRAGPAPRTRRTASSCGDSVDLERALHHLLQPRQIELALPAADDQRRHAVADQIGQRAAFAHELVDTHQQRERLDRDVRHDGKRRGEGDEAGAGDPRGSLRGQHGDGEQGQLLAEAELTLLAIAMLTSKGASGVTGAGFVTLAATLSIVPDIPIQSLALLVGIDKFMSECRALTNLVGNGVATLVISRWERELDLTRLP